MPALRFRLESAPAQAGDEPPGPRAARPHPQAGRVDGQELSPELQLMLRLKKLARVPGGRDPAAGPRPAPSCGASSGSSAGASRSARCATSRSTAPRARCARGSTSRRSALEPTRRRRCSTSTAAAGCTATSRATTPPAGSWPRTPAYRCWRSTTGSPPSTSSLRRSRTARRRTAGSSTTPTTSTPTLTRLAVGGDSAGGALSLSTAVWAAEKGLPMAFQLLDLPRRRLRGAHREPPDVRRGLRADRAVHDRRRGGVLRTGRRQGAPRRLRRYAVPDFPGRRRARPTW